MEGRESPDFMFKSAIDRHKGKPPVEDSNHDLDLPPLSREAVHAALRESSNNLPRFLFRSWTNGSGGYKGLNTPGRITPLAFMRDNIRETIFEIDHQHFMQTLCDHLTTNDGIATLCSSWSDSYAFALSVAIGGEGLANLEDNWISIVDVSKLDKTVNNVLWLGAQKLQDLPRVVAAAEEFQIFGAVSGPALRSARLQEFLAEIHRLPRAINGKVDFGVITKPSSPASWEVMSIEERNDRVQDAKKIGRSFGAGEFGMVAAVFYLAAAAPKLSRYGDILLTLERTFDIDVGEWKEDQGIMRGDFVSNRLTEVEGAVAALRKIMRRAGAREGM